MQRVKLSLACLLCLSWASAALAQTALESDLGVATLQDYSGGVSYGGAYFDVRTMTGDGVGYRNGYTQLGMLYPVWVTEDMYIAPNVRLLLTDNSDIGVNVGSNLRRYSADQDRIFGGYTYFDSDNSAEGFSYSQFMFGLETLGERWDARFNAYFPTNSDENFLGAKSLGTDPIFFGNRLGFIGVGAFQEAISGADIEAGMPLTKRTPWLRGYAGVYAYSADEDDPVGFRGRIDASISDDLMVGVNVTSDSNFGTNVNAVVDFRFSGWKPTRYFPQWTTRERMLQPVQRNWRVATANTDKEVLVAGKNPRTGDEYFVVHVDASNNQPGDGTFENPFSTLPATAPGADLILVQRDGTSIINPLSGSITLSDYQRLLGEGKAHTADIIGMFGGIMTTGNYVLPGFVDDGNFPYLTSGGNIVTIASNNEVSAFNLINAAGFAITNNPLAGSNNFNLNCLNITGNNGGIFLSNVTGTGILRDINALNNNLGGISLDTGLTPLNLTGTNIVSSSLPAGVQDFGMRLSADPGTINATLTNLQLNRNVDGLLLDGDGGDLNIAITDASIDDNLNDGIRITGVAADIALSLRDTTVNRSGAEGIQSITTGGSLTILGRNVTANTSGLDNVNLAMTNTDMAIDFENATFNNSVGGSGFVLSNTGGSGGGTLRLENVTGTGNFLDGLSISGDNFTEIAATVRQSVFSNNGRDAMFISSTNGADVAVGIRSTVATNSGRHGINFNATGNATLDIDARLSNFNNSGSNAALAGNGVNGFVDDSLVDVTLLATTAANSGNNGMFVTAQNDAQVTINVNQGNFQNSGQNTAGGDAVNLVTDTGADVILQINNTPLNNTVAVPGGTQDDGLAITSSGGSTVLGNISNLDMSNNLSNAIQAIVTDLNTSVTLNLLNVTGDGSGEDGILFDVQNDGQLTINSQTASFNSSGAGGTGDGVDGFIRTGGDVTFNWVATTARNSAENGMLLDVSDAGSTFTANIQSGNFSDSGQALLGLNQQDAFHITAANDGDVSISMLNTPSANSFTPPAGTQQRSLWASVTTGADLTFVNQSGDMSNNLLNAINVTVANAGSSANLNISATPANNSGEDGFLFNVSDSGAMVAQLTDSTFDNSGSTGIIGDDFDAIDGVIDTNGIVVLNFVNTPVTNANNDGLQIVASNDALLLATFNNSPFDNAGTNNSGDAVRLDFSTGAQGTVSLLNGSTATNAGDDAIFVTATDLDTLVNVIVTDGDLSDSGTTASAGGGNGIRSLVTNDAEVNLAITNTDVTNTNPTTPQVRGLYFEVTAGGQLTAAFDNSDLSGHDLDGINGSVDGAGVLDSTALISLTDTLVDSNNLFGGIFNVTNDGDLGIITGGASSFSNNGATGLYVNVDGAGSTFGFSFDGTTIDGNGALVGGDGMTVIADNGAVVGGEMNAVSISNNNNGGLTLVVDNGSTADLGVLTNGLVDTVIDGNGNEGLLAIVDNGSELDLSMVGGSVSNNGAAGTAGDLLDSFDNVHVEAANASDVELQFVQTVADGATRNGFNFIAEDSIFLAQMRAGVSASGNTGGSGVRFVATGATTQAVLFMDDESADATLTGTNAFDDNGTALIATSADPNDGFPQAGAGVFFSADTVDVAAIRFSGSANNNGNPADPLVTRDVDGDGDGDDDGVYVNIDTANLAAVEFTGAGTISGNVDDAIDLRLANITLVDTVTQPSEITPPSVVIGAGGPGILVEDLTLDNNGAGLKIVLDGLDLANNDIVIRNNTITNNTQGDGVLLDVTNVTNLDDIVFQNNDISGNGTLAGSLGHGVNLQLNTSPVDMIAFIGLAPAGQAGAIPQNISGNGLDGIHFEFDNSNVAGIFVDNNTISNNGTAANDGDGIGFDVVNNSDVGPVLISNNTIDGNEFDGVSVVNVAPTSGLWDFTFDSNLSISGNQGRGVNFVLGDGVDLNLAMTDNASISNNILEGVNLDLGTNSNVNVTALSGGSISSNGGPGVRVTAGAGSNFTLNVGTAGTPTTFDDNVDGGIAILMTDSATGSFSVVNSQFTNTVNGTDVDFNGDGFVAVQRGSSVLTGSFVSSQFTGNAGDGARFSVTGNDLGVFAQLNNVTIGDGTSAGANTFSNNGSDGLEFFRTADGQINNVVVDFNTFTENTANGLRIVAANQDLADTYTIDNNTINDNGQNGVLFDIRADADIIANMDNNVINNNGSNGIQVIEQVNAGSDSRSISGVWTRNTITENTQNGIHLDGAMDGLVVGNTADPTLGNTISDNENGSGILINGPGTVTIGGNVIQRNGNNAELGTANEDAGIQINVRPFSDVTVQNNLITDNFGDGIQAGISTGFSGFTANFSFLDNIIANNTGRGIDVINRSSNSTNVDITGNFVTGNLLEGIYVVNTSSGTQNQFASSTTDLAADGSVTASSDMRLRVANNEVIGNGLNSAATTTGFFLRVGTTDGGGGSGDAGGFASNGGFTTNPFAEGHTRGGVIASVFDNDFAGNFGDDVLFQSFVSTVDPATSAGTWAATTDPATITTYQSDPLARLDLYFDNNAYDSTDLNNGAGVNSNNTSRVAYYDNAEGTFKSRLNTTSPPFNGPFTSATRRRNAQRQAANPTDTPTGSSFIYSGMGASTFRVNNPSGDFFIIDDTFPYAGVGLPGTIFGELPYSWGTLP